MKYIKKNIFNRMLLIYSALCIISICLLCNVFLKYYIENQVQNELNIHSEVIYNIEKRFEEQENLSNSVINGINTQSRITDELNVLINKSYEEYLSYKLDIFYNNSNTRLDLNYLLETILSNRKDVLAVIIKDKNKNEINEIVFDYDNWYRIKSSNKENEFVRKITKTIQNVDSVYAIGYIDIYFDLSYINTIIKNSNLRGSLGIENGEEELIFYSDKFIGENINEIQEKLNNNKHENLKLEDRDYVFVAKEDAQTKFRYISIIPKHMLDKDMVEIKVTFMSILCVLVIILVTYIVIYKNSQKMKKILKRLNQIKNEDLETRIDIKKEDDELDTICIGINQMCDSLQKSIEKNYVSEVKQKQAEINALQAQIKPHFLYNTLEVIRMCALANKNNDVAAMIYNLAYMFRYSTYNNKNIVTLNEGIKYTKMYLDLCSTRYKGILSYNIDIEEDVCDCIVPKFIIQPVVENFIVHGMRKDSTTNFVNIKAIKDNSNLNIIIEDNGIGIAEDALEKIKMKLQENIQESSSIGLMNINNRIKLKFGEEYGLDIKSEIGKNTVVTCVLPLIKDEGDYV